MSTETDDIVTITPDDGMLDEAPPGAADEKGESKADIEETSVARDNERKSKSFSSVVVGDEGSDGDGPGDLLVRKDAIGDETFREYYPIHREPSPHYEQMFYAVMNLLLFLARLVFDIMLIVWLIGNEHPGSAASVIFLYCFDAVTHIFFDWINHGRTKFWLGDVFMMRTLVDFMLYCEKWTAMKHQVWRQPWFQNEAGFDTLVPSIASLMVQTYVIVDDTNRAIDARERYTPSYIQMAALFLNSITASLALFKFYKYLNLPMKLYMVMFVKAMITTALRIVLITAMVAELGAAFIPLMLVSFLLGFAVYGYGTYVTTIKHGREDPLVYSGVHLGFGFMVATLQMLVSFPFAPSYRTGDWWIGYLVSEGKLQFENTLCVCVAMYVYYREEGVEDFAILFFFTTSMIVLQLVALAYLHFKVRNRIRYSYLSGYYSTEPISRLFDHWGEHLEQLIRNVAEAADADDQVKPRWYARKFVSVLHETEDGLVNVKNKVKSQLQRRMAHAQQDMAGAGESKHVDEDNNNDTEGGDAATNVTVYVDNDNDVRDGLDEPAAPNEDVAETPLEYNPVVKTCVICEALEPSVYCIDCDQGYCAEDDVAYHKDHRHKLHKRHPYNPILNAETVG